MSSIYSIRKKKPRTKHPTSSSMFPAFNLHLIYVCRRPKKKRMSCPYKESDPKSPESCPVKGNESASAVYNVYSQKINPNNMMPPVNQKPAPGQVEPLSTFRQQSTIPKGGTDESWVYPSEQMFYNALVRKGKGDDVAESDVAMMIAIHNHMNEKTWKELMRWEQAHHSECAMPRLSRFCGRPDDLSPKARLKTWLGWPMPFDRHDWVVDRCGKEVRYIIDYYHNDDAEKETDKGSQFKKAIDIDVRPALDSFGSFFDRCRMVMRDVFGSN
eukprot:Rmarinus@m.16466